MYFQGWLFCIYISDLNECGRSIDHCSRFANCANERGSYACTCSHEYVGDGFECYYKYAGNIWGLLSYYFSAFIFRYAMNWMILYIYKKKIYSLGSYVKHSSSTVFFHWSLSWAWCSIWVHRRPICHSSCSADLLQLFFGLPRFLFPWGFQKSAFLVTLLLCLLIIELKMASLQWKLVQGEYFSTSWLLMPVPVLAVTAKLDSIQSQILLLGRLELLLLQVFCFLHFLIRLKTVSHPREWW